MHTAPALAGASSEADEEEEELSFHDAAAEEGEGDETEEDEEDDGDEGAMTTHRTHYHHPHRESDEKEEEEEEAGGAIDPHASPDGRWAAFVRRGELYVVPLVAPPPASASVRGWLYAYLLCG